MKYKDLNLCSVYQPIFDSNLQVIGLEALVRITDNNNVNIRPDIFFDSADVDLDDKINVERLSRVIHIRNFSVSRYRHLKLFLNVLPSAGEFFAFEEIRIQLLDKRLRALDLEPSQIIMEVVELEARDDHCLKTAMQRLVETGFEIAIDDFGMNASNYHRVALLKPNIIKIDRSLLLDYMQGDTSPLLDAVALARKIGAKIVIEGIENEEQLIAMQLLDLDFYQGYFLAMPKSIELVEYDTAADF
nr:EAL domain-containing protein [Vibrio taketomensis]